MTNADEKKRVGVHTRRVHTDIRYRTPGTDGSYIHSRVRVTNVLPQTEDVVEELPTCDGTRFGTINRGQVPRNTEGGRENTTTAEPSAKRKIEHFV